MESVAPFSWRGITRNESYVSAGAIYAENVRFYIEGELQERRGLAYQTTQAGNVMLNYLHPQSGYWAIWASPGGNLVAESL